MYVNQIDDYIDKMLDKMFFDKRFKDLISHKWVNFVEHTKEINGFIQTFFDELDADFIRKIINNKNNVEQIRDMIKRYIAYYVFLSLAYSYPSTMRDFRNNLIQYAKSQEISTFVVRNFFDTFNNYTIVQYFQLIKGVSKILLLTDLERATLDKVRTADATKFLDQLGKQYVDNYLLQVVDGNVEINSHNLIKTIVFGEIYQNQERKKVFEILDETEEADRNYVYIDIVVTDNSVTDFSTYLELFRGKRNASYLANILYEMVTNPKDIVEVLTIDDKNNNLVGMPMVLPIVDNFLRYHQDSYKIESENARNTLPLFEKNNADNVRDILLQQKRNKTSDTMVRLVINNIDAIAEYYSPSVQNNPELKAKIDKYFENIFHTRKAVIHNYNEEVFIANKIKNHGKFSNEMRESYLEITDIIKNPYFNFRDFMNYGTKLMLEKDYCVTVLRYSNIQYPAQNELLDVHTIAPEKTLNLVGIALYPMSGTSLFCLKRRNIVDIRSLDIPDVGENGFERYLYMIKALYVDTIFYNKKVPYYDYSVPRKTWSGIYNSVIYWIYDLEKDKYVTDSYENINVSDNQAVIKHMNSVLYDRIMEMFVAKVHEIIMYYDNISIINIDRVINQFIAQIGLVGIDVNDLLNEYQRHKKLLPYQERSEPPKVNKPTFSPIVQKKTSYMEIDMVNPIHPQKIVAIKNTAKTDGPKSIQCQHEVEWNRIMEHKDGNVNLFNDMLSKFMDKYVSKTTYLEFNCQICGQNLPAVQWVKDTTFDATTDQLLVQYVPDTTPLQEISEYVPYSNIIEWMDYLIGTRLARITGMNMFSGNDPQAVQKRKIMVKSIIDLILLHNKQNKAKTLTSDARAGFMLRNFGVQDEYDQVVFFTLTNKLSNDSEADRIIMHNVLTYIMLQYIIELTGSQIISMEFDKFSTMNTYLKAGHTLFKDLKIRTNKSDTETVPITNYPVLCYLVYAMGHFMFKHKVWKVEGVDPTKFSPQIIRTQVHTFVDLINSIIMDSSRNDDYVYKMTSSKIFVQMNKVFNDMTIVKMLQNFQGDYSGTKDALPHVGKVHYVPIDTPTVFLSRKISDAMSASFEYAKSYINEYHYLYDYTDVSNCEDGRFQRWLSKDRVIRSVTCHDMLITDVKDVSRFEAYYYYFIDGVAKTKRCLTGNLHDFEHGQCKICKRPIDDKYTKAELDTLTNNLVKLLNSMTKQSFLLETKVEQREEKREAKRQAIYKKVESSESGNVTQNVAKLIKVMSEYVDPSADLGYENTTYLNKNVYTIDHDYKGKKIPDLILDDKRLVYVANQDHYKTAVIYYNDNKNDVSVYYDALTRRYLGYRPKHKEYVDSTVTGLYIKVNLSVREKLELAAWPSQYIRIKNKTQNYMNGLLRLHLQKVKAMVDTFCSIISQIKNADDPVDPIVIKYRNPDIVLPKSLTEWKAIREKFTFVPITWENIPDTANTLTLNESDKTSGYVYKWLADMLTEFINVNAHTNKVNIVQLIVSIVNHVYSINNTDAYTNSFELKLFDYMIYGSNMMEDYYRKGFRATDKVVVELAEETEEEKEDRLDETETLEAVDMEMGEEDDEWMGASDSTD